MLVPIDGQILVGEPEMATHHIQQTVSVAKVRFHTGRGAIPQVAEFLELR